MERDQLTEFEASLTDRTCRVTRREADWCVEMDDGTSIALSVPWRIVSKGRIAFADDDDGQKFGLPEPVDGEAETRRLLSGKRIVKAVVDRQTADLTLYFEQDTQLDAFNNSSGYEGWEAQCPLGGKWRSVIALGGGGIVVLAHDH